MEQQKEVMTREDIAEMFGYSPGTVSNKLCRGDEFPKPIRLPGSNRPLWRRSSVMAFLAKYEQVDGFPRITKRGRKPRVCG